MKYSTLALSLLGAASVQGAVFFNEISASTTSTDLEFFELYTTVADEDLSAYSILVLESDDDSSATNNFGRINQVVALGTATGNFFSVTPASALVNEAATYLLVDGFSGASGDDLDSDNDGTLDSTPWTSVIDSVGLNTNDNTTTAIFYTTLVLGASIDGAPSTFGPGGAALKVDGVAGTASDWVRLDFGINTPGIESNSPYDPAAPADYVPTPGFANVIPEPSTGLLGGLALLGLLRRRR